MSSTQPNGFAFVDAAMVVVQAIGGDLNPEQLAQFERDYSVLFGSEFSVPVMPDVVVWIGGRYNPDTGEFSPPEQQEEIVP